MDIKLSHPAAQHRQCCGCRVLLHVAATRRRREQETSLPRGRPASESIMESRRGTLAEGHRVHGIASDE